MSFNNDILFSEPYYKWVFMENIESIDVYNNFSNWVSGEFDL